MFYDNFVRLCNEKGQKPTPTAKEIGFSSAALVKWKNGTTPRGSALQKIADYFGVTVNDLLTDTPAQADPSTRIPDRREYGRVKIVSQVAAGLPIEAIDVFDQNDPDDWEELEKSLLSSGEYFGLRVRGDSMETEFHDGDIVIVRKQDTADEGDIVVVTENGHTGTVKKIHYRADGITLIALNPDYPPIKYTADECRTIPVLIAGKVVRLHREIK